MIKLVCGKDLVRLGIQTNEGLNISSFLDHLKECGEMPTGRAGACGCAQSGDWVGRRSGEGGNFLACFEKIDCGAT